jgi:hypothetical protein
MSMTQPTVAVRRKRKRTHARTDADEAHGVRDQQLINSSVPTGASTSVVCITPHTSDASTHHLQAGQGVHQPSELRSTAATTGRQAGKHAGMHASSALSWRPSPATETHPLFLFVHRLAGLRVICLSVLPPHTTPPHSCSLVWCCGSRDKAHERSDCCYIHVLLSIDRLGGWPTTSTKNPPSPRHF